MLEGSSCFSEELKTVFGLCNSPCKSQITVYLVHAGRRFLCVDKLQIQFQTYVFVVEDHPILKALFHVIGLQCLSNLNLVKYFGEVSIENWLDPSFFSYVHVWKYFTFFYWEKFQRRTENICIFTDFTGIFRWPNIQQCKLIMQIAYCLWCICILNNWPDDNTVLCLDWKGAFLRPLFSPFIMLVPLLAIRSVLSVT